MSVPAVPNDSNGARSMSPKGRSLAASVPCPQTAGGPLASVGSRGQKRKLPPLRSLAYSGQWVQYPNIGGLTPWWLGGTRENYWWCPPLRTAFRDAENSSTPMKTNLKTLIATGAALLMTSSMHAETPSNPKLSIAPFRRQSKGRHENDTRPS